jgi:hypothetical protein
LPHQAKKAAGQALLEDHFCSAKDPGLMLGFYKSFRHFWRKMAKNWRIGLYINKAKLGKYFIITLVFEKNASFFRRKLSKIAENCDHYIDPRREHIYSLN